MKTLNISTLVKIILIALCCSVITISLYSLDTIRSTPKAFQSVRTLNGNLRQLNIMTQSLTLVRGKINYLFNNDHVSHAYIDGQVDILKKGLASAKESIAVFDKISDLDEESHNLAKAIDVAFAAVAEAYNGNIVSLESYVNNNVDNEKVETALDNAINDYASYSYDIEGELVEKFNQEYHSFLIVSSILLLAAVIISLISYFIIKRSVFDRLEHTSDMLRKIGAGELFHDIKLGARNEIGTMLEALKMMQQSLSKMIHSVRTTSEEIRTNASEIDVANHNLASRTEEQSSALQQTAASMEQIKTTVSNNTENARQANDLAFKARNTAESGSSVMAEVVTTMDKISQSARKISEINSVIDGIANQTNILALNAAVEAARAGEQGRGFSVVATEVRNLAKRSADAAKEISVLINQSVKNVDDGAKLIENAGSTMQEIVTSVTQVSDIMQEITQASEEQSSGVGQISTAVNEMDLATQQNAAMVEEASAIFHNMNDNARGLNELVSAFRLASGEEHKKKNPRELNFSRKINPVKAETLNETDYKSEFSASDDTGGWSEF